MTAPEHQPGGTPSTSLWFLPTLLFGRPSFVRYPYSCLSMPSCWSTEPRGATASGQLTRQSGFGAHGGRPALPAAIPSGSSATTSDDKSLPGSGSTAGRCPALDNDPADPRSIAGSISTCG